MRGQFLVHRARLDERQTPWGERGAQRGGADQDGVAAGRQGRDDQAVQFGRCRVVLRAGRLIFTLTLRCPSLSSVGEGVR